ncbi:formate dehydrogenase accessory sulfurtransferase FdhD [Celerinatantimonas yamalensis]|uniref:Sulfur carrier protein FdhD n=1 Tax=Celerinatantimonas yamalensis TaxID=559956 RepID=A0ABW9G3F0_9GAMM
MLTHDHAPGLSSIYRQRINRHQDAQLEQDYVAIEEPLQISLQWYDLASSEPMRREWSMTMRTPGDDVALIQGLILTQQVVNSLDDVMLIEPFDPEGRHAANHLVVTLKEGVSPDWQQLQRSYMSQSSCGICGMTSMRSLCLKHPIKLDEQAGWLGGDDVLAMPEQLRQMQPLFAKTGAVHGAGYWHDRQLPVLAEDVGRHNAVDKLIGHIYQQTLWQAQCVLVLSGRVSFELVQKAMLAAIPVIVAVGAPSSLAIDMAKQFNMTLIGFTKRNQFNVYHGHWRLR